MLLALNPSLRASGLYPEVVTFNCPQGTPRCRQRTSSSFRLLHQLITRVPLVPDRNTHTSHIHYLGSHSFARYTLRRPCDPPFSQLQLYYVVCTVVPRYSQVQYLGTYLGTHIRTLLTPTSALHRHNVANVGNRHPACSPHQRSGRVEWGDCDDILLLVTSHGGFILHGYSLSIYSEYIHSTSRQADMPSRTSQQIVQANKHHDKSFPIVWKHPREAKEGCTDQALALKIESPIRDTPNLISKPLPWAPLAMYSDESMSWELGIREGSLAFSKHGNFQFPINPGYTTRGLRGTGALPKPSARALTHTHTYTHTHKVLAVPALVMDDSGPVDWREFALRA